ncbi:MAG: aminotransferase class I/II-fold pyridoxal phosphate-dependent enzyme [Bacteroidota bacterium]
MQQNVSILEKAFDPESFRELGHQLIDQLADFVLAGQNRSAEQVIPYSAPNALYEKWDQAEGSVWEKVLQHSIRLHHPRYLGHQIATPPPIGALAGLLADTINNGMGVYEMGMAGTVIERKLVEWLGQKMNLGTEVSGFLTSGGSLGNLTALLAARQAATDTDIWTEGQAGQKPFAVLVSEEAHYCVDRAVKIMGWGENGIVKVPTDNAYRMRPESLPEALAEAKKRGRHVVAVIASACSTATGSFDDIDKIADFCAENGIWLHVDAAHGGGIVFSKKYRRLLKGIGRADSVVMDFHKMALSPALSTALLFRRPQSGYSTFAQKASYLWESEGDAEWFNLARRTFECTKHMMGLRVYVLKEMFGDQLFAAFIDQVMDLGKVFADLIHHKPDFDLLLSPACNIVCFRYAPGTSEDHNQLNADIRQRLVESGRFYIVQTEIKGQRFLRVSIMNPFSTKSDLEALLQEVEKIGQKLIQAEH